ncbi:MAG: hypothetical protein H0V53_13400 [Rubrobacter sp.]|nr:hypothetical protein [Rubrobacter sp.]
MESLIVQASGSGNNIIDVYPDRVELRSGWQSQNREAIDHRDISSVEVKGLVNCVLTLETNKGRLVRLENLALGEARKIKTSIELQKSRAAQQS